MTSRSFFGAVLFGLLALGTGTTGTVGNAQTHGVTTYQAEYEARYKGRRVGSSEFSVTRNEGSEAYEFKSVSRFRGLLKLFSPRPVVEVSEFTVENGRIRPLAYSYEDGSRKGKDNFQIVFDWDNGVATTTAEDQTIQSELVDGALDRGSMQVALMIDMHAEGPWSYTLIDEDGMRVYEYSADGEEILATPLGNIATRKYVQQRPGSSRRTLMWLAGGLNDLPVRIEQQRDGETRAAFHLQSVEWLDGAD